jgi:hypothetical protein
MHPLPIFAINAIILAMLFATENKVSNVSMT